MKPFKPWYSLLDFQQKNQSISNFLFFFFQNGFNSKWQKKSGKKEKTLGKKMQDLPIDTECLWQQLVSFTNVLFARESLIKSQRLLKFTAVMYNVVWNKK